MSAIQAATCAIPFTDYVLYVFLMFFESVAYCVVDQACMYFSTHCVNVLHNFPGLYIEPRFVVSTAGFHVQLDYCFFAASRAKYHYYNSDIALYEFVLVWLNHGYIY